MKYNEITELSDAQLTEKLDEVSTSYTRMKLSHSVSPMEKPSLLKENRKHIARLKTEQSARRNNNNPVAENK